MLLPTDRLCPPSLLQAPGMAWGEVHRSYGFGGDASGPDSGMPGHRRSLPQGSQPDLAEAEVQVPLSFHKAWHGVTLLEALGVGYFFAILFWTPRPPRNPPWCPRLNILPAAQASSAGGVLQSKAMEDCGVGGCVLKRPLQEQRASRSSQASRPRHW